MALGSSEELVHNLQRLLQTLTLGHQELVGALTHLEAGTKALETAADRACGQLTALTTAHGSMCHDLTEGQQALAESVAQFDSTIEAGTAALQHAEVNLAAGQAEAVEAASDAWKSTEKAASAALEAISRGQESVGALLQQQEASRRNDRAATGALDQAIVETRDYVVMSHDEAAKSLGAFGQTIGEDATEATDQCFQDLTSGAEDATHREVDEIFRNLELGLQIAVGMFSEGVEKHGRAWSDAAARVMDATGKDLGDKLGPQVKHGVERFLKEGVAELANEVRNQRDLMEEGRRITGSLSPVLPEFVAARATLQEMNFLLDIFDQ